MGPSFIAWGAIVALTSAVDMLTPQLPVHVGHAFLYGGLALFIRWVLEVSSRRERSDKGSDAGGKE
jgi:hypothetical protein